MKNMTVSATMQNGKPKGASKENKGAHIAGCKLRG